MSKHRLEKYTKEEMIELEKVKLTLSVSNSE